MHYQASRTAKQERAHQQSMSEMLLRRQEIDLLTTLAFAAPPTAPPAQFIPNKEQVTIRVDEEEHPYTEPAVIGPAAHRYNLRFPQYFRSFEC